MTAGPALTTDRGLSRDFSAPFPVNVPLTLSVHRRGGGDPTYASDAAGAVWRTSLTPDGPAILSLRSRDAVITARAWGPGAGWLLDQVPGWLGFHDDRSGFAAHHPVVGELALRYEGLRVGSAVTNLGTVPTAAMKNGDFSGRTTIRDPNTGQPFPGNVIPPNRISPVGQMLLSFYPDPTFDTPAGAAVTLNYAYNATRTENMNQHIVKIDHTFNQKDSGFFTANYYKTDFIERVSVPSCGASPLPKFGCTGSIKIGIFGISEIHAFTPSMVNEVKFDIWWRKTAIQGQLATCSGVRLGLIR
jgi:hypothetical protein